jgi:TP901 family phage tail tape measure protein
MGITIARLLVEIGATSEAARSELARVGNDLNSYGDKMMRTGGLMTAGISVPLALLGKSAANLTRDYQEQMNILGAASKASAEEMEMLGGLAEQLGADLTLPATSAADAASAMVELGKAGLQVNDIMGAARGVLQLSAAGQLSNADAAEVASNALNVFKLKGDQAVRVADLLAASANTSSAEVSDMADAFKMSAAVAASSSIPIEDLTTGLTLMANAGIKGSDAGTSWKQMILSLQAPTDKAADLMGKLGIDIYDINGAMLDQRDIIGNFSKSLGDMSDAQRNAALATIFGSDAVRAANIILMGGQDQFDKAKVSVTEYGAAAKLADARLQGLPGSLDRMTSSLETAQLALGEAASGPISDLADTVTTLANGFADLDAETQEMIVKLGLMAIAAGPTMTAVGGLMKVAGGLSTAFAGAGAGLAEWRAGMSLTTALGAAGLSPIAIGLGAISAAVVSLVGVWAAWNENIEKTNDIGAEAVDNAWNDFFKKQIEEGKSATEILNEYRAAQARMRDEMSIQWGTGAGGERTLEAGELAKIFIQNKDGILDGSQDLSNALAQVSASYYDYAKAMGEAGNVSQQLTEEQWLAAQSTNDALVSTTGSYQEYVQTMSDTGQTLSILTEEQWKSSESLSQMATEAQLAKTQFDELGQAQDDLQAKMKDWMDNAANQVVDMLGGRFTEASESYRSALGVVDETLGTNYLSNLQFKDSVKELVDQYARSKDLDAFKSGLEAIKSEGLADMQTALEDAATKAQELYDKLMNLPEEVRIKIAFDVDAFPEFGNGTGNGYVNNLNAVPEANGGDWLVTRPTLFMAGEAGWERATFQPVGGGNKSSSSSELPPIQIIGNVRSEEDIYKLAQHVAEEIRRNKL